MKELGPAAREFVESHRRDSSLPETARARIKQKLMLRVSTIAATTAIAGTAAGMSLAAKVVVVALGVSGAVGAGSISVWALRSRAPTHVTRIERSVRPVREIGAAAPPPAPDRPTPVIVAAAPASVAAPGRAAMRTVAAASVEARASRPATQNRTPAAPAIEAFDPEPELRALREARDDLRAGRPARAYRRLEDFNRQSPAGMLAQERHALTAIALCQAQPGREAQDRAAEFLRRSPESPLAARVKSACDPARKPSW
jgi:hypothetical protein